jgi:tRNA pseudouridine32 synthase/23S rRNA pseudouridine746 synthase
VDSLTILFRDAYFIAVDKPSGLLTIPDGYDPTLPNLKSILSAQIGRVWTVHRLDKETSGVVIFALTAEAHRNLSIEFEARNVKKEYRALVTGEIVLENFCIDFPLRVNGDRRHRTIVDQKKGKPATTCIQLVNRYSECSEIKAFPLTGYTHQIRAHLFAFGHPIINDSVYNAGKLPKLELLTRLMLHAHQISFSHPFTDQLTQIQSPVPPDFMI